MAGEKILRCAQNDNRGEARNDGGRRRMTKEECCHSEERISPLSVILRSFAPKNLRDGAFGMRGKILRCAQNDNGGEARNDNGGGKRREKRFFAALRMTMGGEARNDGGRRKDSSLRSE